MPEKTTDKHRASYIPFRCDANTYETICKIAQANKLTRVEVLRNLVQGGLVRQGYVQDEDAMCELVKDALKEILTPQVERLATINAKATQISGAAYFLLVYVLRMYFPESDKSMVDDVATQARQLGIQYLKLRQGMDIDEFIKNGIKKMNDDNAGWKGARDDD